MIGTRFFARQAAPVLTGMAIAASLGMAFADAGFAASTDSPWVDQTNSKVRLVSGTVMKKDGTPEPFAGVQLRMAPGWKTYWRNPGDSGVPPSFDWSGSKNLKSAEVLYPAPHRFADANGTAIGYGDEVVFPVKITPERDGEPVELKLDFEYGLCKELCIPNDASLDLALPTDLGKGDALLLEAALARVPEPEQADALPKITHIAATLDGPAPALEIEATFPEGATGTDLFVENSEVFVPVPKALGPLTDGKQRFVVAFMSATEADAIKGKSLTFTLVSDEGSTTTAWTAE
jgi:DsbC/DsbD-like thiol-disulfide interchange protein